MRSDLIEALEAEIRERRGETSPFLDQSQPSARCSDVSKLTVGGLSKILQKGEGLTNGKKRRIGNLLISKTIYVFAVSLARAKVWIVAVRVHRGLGRAVRVWPRPNANAFGHKRLGVAQRGPVKGHRR